MGVTLKGMVVGMGLWAASGGDGESERLRLDRSRTC